MQSAAILQAYLDRIAEAVMAEDFASYRSGVVLPFHLVTHSENLVIHDEDALRAGFTNFHAMLQSQRVTDYIRLVESAQSLDPELITGRYVTHVIAGGLRVLEPFHSQITLRLVDGRWCAASISNALANSRWPQFLSSPLQTDPQKGPEQ